MREISRRHLLEAAGGITFSALCSEGLPTFAGVMGRTSAQTLPPPLPVFTALPYLQPGSASALPTDGSESIAIAWQTNGVGAKFELEFGRSAGLDQMAGVLRSERLSEDRDDGERRLNHTATLGDLRLNRRYQYRVRMNGELLLEGYFTTRKPRGAPTRFVAFGDNSCGSISDHAIAYYAYRARPDFVMNLGDNVYSNGRDSEYERSFFPVYNADSAGPRSGAPLMRSAPYYSVIANHDLTGSDAQHHPVVDFSRYVDAAGYYTNLHLPLNGPAPANPTPAVGDAFALGHFKECAGPRFPRMANYSFDYGDGHFLCLDSNVYVDPTDARLQSWIANDLRSTDAEWKFVIYHHPAFNFGADHYAEQHMRVLTPLFEQHGVSIVMSGHEHNYQRTRPLRFAPAGDAGAKQVNSGHRLVPGKFRIDSRFDGKTVTKPDGIVYIVSGAGGANLYDAQFNENPEAWRHAEDESVQTGARMISDRHSLTVVEMDSKRLTFKQIDEWGREIDRFHVTKT